MVDGYLSVCFADGRELRLPLEYFTALRDAPLKQVENVELVTCGRGLHWPDLDEDLRVSDLLYPAQISSLVDTLTSDTVR